LPIKLQNSRFSTALVSPVPTSAKKMQDVEQINFTWMLGKPIRFMFGYNKIKAKQTDKDDKLVILYASNADEHAG